MRVVIDTNVLISAVIRDRLPERVLRWCLTQPDFEWIVSPVILAEYESVIRRPKFRLDAGTINRWLELIYLDTLLTNGPTDIDFPRDPKDTPFLACATWSHADFLITGDHDFSEAPNQITSQIVNVRQFVEIVQPALLDAQT